MRVLELLASIPLILSMNVCKPYMNLIPDEVFNSIASHLNPVSAHRLSLTSKSVWSKFYDCDSPIVGMIKCGISKYLKYIKRVQYNQDISRDVCLLFRALNGHLVNAKLYKNLSRLDKKHWENQFCEAVQRGQIQLESSDVFYLAASYGHLNMVKLLLDRGLDSDPENLEATIYDAIAEASSAGQFEVVQFLLSGSLIDQHSQNNVAIINAFRNGHLNIVDLLIKFPDTIDIDQVNKTDFEIVQSFLKTRRVRTGLINAVFEAVCEGGLFLIAEMLLKDVRVNPGYNFNSPIRWAALQGHEEIVRMLLNHPRVNPADDSNGAIRWASRFGRLKVVKMLLNDKRVDPLANNNEALRFALENGHEAIAEILAKHNQRTPNEEDGTQYN